MFSEDQFGMFEEELHTGGMDPISQGISSAIALVQGEISRHDLAAKMAPSMDSWQQDSSYVTEGIETWDIGAFDAMRLDLLAIQRSKVSACDRNALRRLRNLFQHLGQYASTQRSQQESTNSLSSVAWKHAEEILKSAHKALHAELGGDQVSRIRPELQKALESRFGNSQNSLSL